VFAVKKEYDDAAKDRLFFQESIRQLSIILQALITGWSQ
jgi:hypothetical protein